MPVVVAVEDTGGDPVVLDMPVAVMAVHHLRAIRTDHPRLLTPAAVAAVLPSIGGITEVEQVVPVS